MDGGSRDFQKGECGIFLGSSATRADIKANSKFEVGYGMLPILAPNVAGRAPQNTIIGGANFVGAARTAPRAEYKGRRKILRLPCRSRRIQAAWHSEHRLPADHPRSLRPHPRAGFLRSQSRHRDLGSSR